MDSLASEWTQKNNKVIIIKVIGNIVFGRFEVRQVQKNILILRIKMGVNMIRIDDVFFLNILSKIILIS